MFRNELVSLVCSSGCCLSMKLASILFAMLVSVGAYADWVSDVDKSYSEKNPRLAAIVLEAKKIIDDPLSKKHNNQVAIVMLNSVVDEDPGFAPAYVQIARAYSYIGLNGRNTYSEASLSEMEAALREALRIEPYYDYALVMMGYTKMFQGNYGDAEKYYFQAKSLNSKYPYLMSQMAQLSTKKGDYKKAIEIALDGFEANKSDPVAAAAMVTEIIFAYEKLDGNYRDELNKWQLVRANLRPDVPSFLLEYASLRLEKFGDYETAIEYSRRTLKLANYHDARMVLAGGYYAKWADLKARNANSVEVESAFQTALSFWHPSEDLIQNMSDNEPLRSTADALVAEAANRNIQIYKTMKGKDGMTIYLKTVDKDKE